MKVKAHYHNELHRILNNDISRDYAQAKLGRPPWNEIECSILKVQWRKIE